GYFRSSLTDIIRGTSERIALVTPGLGVIPALEIMSKLWIIVNPTGKHAGVH
ncbi:Hypothetical predicted protein, partial [Podarcis lilfordi]